MLSHPIQSYFILILSYPILSYSILILFYPFISCPVLSCRILYYYIISYYLILSCSVLLYPILSLYDIYYFSPSLLLFFFHSSHASRLSIIFSFIFSSFSPLLSVQYHSLILLDCLNPSCRSFYSRCGSERFDAIFQVRTLTHI